MTALERTEMQIAQSLVTPIEWREGCIRLLDQSRLPREEVFLDLRDTDEVVRAIREMRVRGAPAIGVTAAYGMALAAGRLEGTEREAALDGLREAARDLGASRPTAVNLKMGRRPHDARRGRHRTRH